MKSQSFLSVTHRKSINSRLPGFLLISVLLFLAAPAHARYGGGTGVLEDPFLIAKPEHLYEIGTHQEDWDKYFKMTADIDLVAYKNIPFNQIGRDYYLPFAGFFDGNGHTISNFTHHAQTASVGLIGHVGYMATVKNLGMINVDVSGVDSVGGIAGGSSGGFGSIINCYVTGKVSGRSFVGGLVGRHNGRVMNCYSTAEVSGDQGAAGLVGLNDGGLIYNSYAAGWVTSNALALGLAGHGDSGIIVGSFWDMETTGQVNNPGGHGRTTAEMKMAATFIGWGGCESEGAWTIDEGKDYPRLAWQRKPGKLITGKFSDIAPGGGTPADPYLISTAEQLNAIGLFPCERGRHFRLMADIDLFGYEGTEFNKIGAGWPFTGTFDGNRHTISNFTFDTRPAGEDDVGLFGTIATSGVVKNLGLINVNVIGSWRGAAGLAGRNSGKISNCYVTGKVSVSWMGGGLVSWNNGTITTSWATAGVTGSNTLGGLMGKNEGTISDCYAIAPVSANYEADGSGGLVGNNAGQISKCYSAGPVSGPRSVLGGLAGVGSPTLVANSFWDVQTTGQTLSAGGAGKPTVLMKTKKTFTDAGWDFVGETANGTKDTWSIAEGADYPRLSWAAVAGGPFPPDGATSVDPNVILSWAPSLTAESHDVYFGDNRVNVEAGTGGTFRANQIGTSFTVGLPGHPYPDGLVAGATYYWRIDEHNAGKSVVKGPIWSFTVKPFTPPEETVEYQVTASEDDVYAINNSLQNLDTDFLRVGSSSFTKPPYYMSGMVFRDVNVPKGKQILSAHLKVRAHNNRLTDKVYGTIQAEAANNAAVFDPSRHVGSLPRTTASVNWDLEQPWSADEWYESPDIAGVIQEVVNRAGWSANNAIAILYSTRSEGGYRNFSAFDRGSDYAAKLEITFVP